MDTGIEDVSALGARLLEEPITALLAYSLSHAFSLHLVYSNKSRTLTTFFSY